MLVNPQTEAGTLKLDPSVSTSRKTHKPRIPLAYRRGTLKTAKLQATVGSGLTEINLDLVPVG